jgi:hypothetical protein
MFAGQVSPGRNVSIGRSLDLKGRGVHLTSSRQILKADFPGVFFKDQIKLRTLEFNLCYVMLCV